MIKIYKFYIDNCLPCNTITNFLETYATQLPEIISINLYENEEYKKYIKNVPRLYLINDEISIYDQLKDNYYDINNIYKLFMLYNIDIDF